MKTIQVSIVTPNGPVLETEATMLSTKTVTGEIGILPRHIEMIAPLDVTIVRVKKEEKTEYVAVSGGFLEVRPEQVTVLAQTAELAQDIDLARAEEAKKRAKARLESMSDEVNAQRAEFALRRAINRINAKGM